MKIRFCFIIFIFLLSFMLLGCSTNVNNSDSVQSDEPTIPQIDFERLTPPDLTIQIGEETIRPTLGTYSWTKVNQDGTSQSVEVDSEAPPGIVKNHEPVLVNKEDQVQLSFETNPKEYEIREWHGDDTITYMELDLSKHEGVMVLEVLAHWEEGTASYAFLLEKR